MYWDQWEDGGYDADIANPGANVYDAGSNPDGTQIWGDGDLTNGCPPALASGPNPCAVAADDQFVAGDVIILDNDVTIQGTTPGPYSRLATQIFFDGRDKVGATSPVAMSRGAFPPTPGSVMAGGSEMFDTAQWGTLYMAPVGEDTATSNNTPFEDTRWFIMAGPGGATIDVDANGDGDVLDTNDLNDFVMNQGDRKAVDGISDGGTLTVVAGNPVQVNSMTADVDDIFEFRWDALVPKPNWTSDYVTPVGTDTDGTYGCTEIWAYNPNAGQITIYWDRPGGNTYPTSDGNFTVNANQAASSPAATNLLTQGNGARFWTVGTGGNPAPVFSPLSLTDCTNNSTNGRMDDWGAPLVPSSQLSSEVLVGFAPGCSNESYSGICHDLDDTVGGTTPDQTYEFSRSVVFVSAISATNIYVDTNGSGLTCTPGTPTVTGAEKTQIGATALTSYRFDDDPTSRNYVHDLFSSRAYTRDDIIDGWDGTGGRTTPNPITWTNDWTEGGGESTDATAGAIQIVTAATPATLRLQELASTNEAGRWIQRSHNIAAAGITYARLSFQLSSYASLDATDRIAAQVSSNGTTWVTLATYVGPWTAHDHRGIQHQRLHRQPHLHPLHLRG